MDAKQLSRFKSKKTLGKYNVKRHISKSCGEILQNNLVHQINSAKCFSILFDETNDILLQGQM